MTPGDKVYHLGDGRRICRVVLVVAGKRECTIRRKFPGYPELQAVEVKPADLFETPEAARTELRTRVAAAIAKAEAALAKLRAFDFNQPVLDVSEPPRGGK